MRCTYRYIKRKNNRIEIEFVMIIFAMFFISAQLGHEKNNNYIPLVHEVNKITSLYSIYIRKKRTKTKQKSSLFSFFTWNRKKNK